MEDPCIARQEPAQIEAEPEIPEYVDWIVVCPEDLDENGEFHLFEPGMIPLAGVFTPRARERACR